MIVVSAYKRALVGEVNAVNVCERVPASSLLIMVRRGVPALPERGVS